MNTISCFERVWDEVCLVRMVERRNREFKFIRDL